MALIRIFFEDIELDFKKESLTVRREYDAFSDNFSTNFSTYPFLIIENESSKIALGSSDITSINKKKIIPVTILEAGVKYYGELQQLSVIKGFRKCNLKYSSELLKIINKKIADFMPVVSVIPGENNPIPFVEKTTSLLSGEEHWGIYPTNFINKGFPEVKWNFPTMVWKDKFGNKLIPEDAFFSYQGFINKFSDDLTAFEINNYNISNGIITVFNKNIPSPQVYLLSPLYYFSKSIDFSFSGTFIQNPLVKKCLFLSTKNNTSMYPIVDLFLSLNLNTVNWTAGYDPFKILTFTVPYQGSYIFKYNIIEPYTLNPSNSTQIISKILIEIVGVKTEYIYVFDLQSLSNTHKGEYNFSTTQPNTVIYIKYFNVFQDTPTHDFKIYRDYEKEYASMNPTIEIGRYLPDWTVGNYLNYLKNLFNLDITIDDIKRKIILDLNETIEDTEQTLIIDKSLALNSYDLAANSSFVLKHANSTDTALYITKTETIAYTNQDNDFTKKIESKFKTVPRNGYTSDLSNGIEDKDGVGLMIYNHATAPYTSPSINGFHLDIDGTGGIYETFWKRWLKFRINASGCEMRGYFTEIETSKISKAKSVFIDNQKYRIVYIELAEKDNGFFVLKMQLESVNY